MRKRKDQQRCTVAIFLVVVGVAILPARSAGRNNQTEPPVKNEQRTDKPLAGYTAIVVEPFAVEQSAATKDFPRGEEFDLQLSTIASLRASKLFEEVVDATQRPPEKPASAVLPAKQGQRKLILSCTIIGFSKGSSGAGFMTWPLPVGVSKAKARFVFRDADTNAEVFRFEKEAKFQAAASFGVAASEERMAHVKGGLVEALIKEIRKRR